MEEAAPIPNEAMSREVAAFLNELRALVYRAIMAAGGLLTTGDAEPHAPVV